MEDITKLLKKMKECDERTAQAEESKGRKSSLTPKQQYLRSLRGRR